MFGFPSEAEVERLRKEFPVGTRVELVRMDNEPNPDIHPGMRGNVEFVDDAGNIRVRWSYGGEVRVIYGEDECRKLTPEELAEEQKMTEEQTMKEEPELEEAGAEMSM